MSIDKHIKILKYLMYILLIVSMCFGFIDKCHAKTDSVLIGGSTETINTSNDYYSFIKNINTSGFSSYNNGYMTFSMAASRQIEIYTITLYKTNGKGFPCDIGTAQGYIDSNAQVITYTAKCNVDFNDALVNRIQVYGFMHTPPAYLTFSSYASYYSYDTDNNVIQAITNSNSSNAINNMSSAVTNSINNQTNTQHSDSVNTQQKITDINNTLKDSSIDSPNSTTSSWGNMNASNGTITNLLTLPIQLLQAYVNGMNSTCSSFNLGNLFGTDIILPCINVGSLIGSTLWGIIDVLFSGFMIFGIAKKLIKIFNDFTNMKSNQVDELYGGGA